MVWVSCILQRYYFLLTQQYFFRGFFVYEYFLLSSAILSEIMLANYIYRYLFKKISQEDSKYGFLKNCQPIVHFKGRHFRWPSKLWTQALHSNKAHDAHLAKLISTDRDSYIWELNMWCLCFTTRQMLWWVYCCTMIYWCRPCCLICFFSKENLSPATLIPVQPNY